MENGAARVAAVQIKYGIKRSKIGPL